MENMISRYNSEQIETIGMVVEHLSCVSEKENESLKKMCDEYLGFRKQLSEYFLKYVADTCIKKCFDNQRSACCTKEGVIIFFADIFINLLYSDKKETDDLLFALNSLDQGRRCVYLGERGCLWKIKPVICEMFLCNTAKKEIFQKHADASLLWMALKKREKDFKWPDKPVLFDRIEEYFINKGFSSSLMFMHTSPGLIKVKKLSARFRSEAGKK